MMKNIHVAIIGQGRSGRDIHGAYFKRESNTHYQVKYIVDQDEKRRAKALEEYPDVQVFSCYQELFDVKDIDLVVNASYSDQHYAITEDLLLHKFNVLVEKPMARNRYECERLIHIANANNVILNVFQQTFFAPFYLKAQEVVASGILGDIKQVSIAYNGFARRWDWQTLKCRMGGSVYNTGPHPIGLALGFMHFDKSAQVSYSNLDTVLTSGDGEDFAKIIMTADGQPLCDIEIHSNDAFPSNPLKIYGTKGTFTSTFTNYKMKYIVDNENAPQPIQYASLKNEKDEPLYCSEKLITHEEEGELLGSAFTSAVDIFYQNLYEQLIGGEQKVVAPAHIAQLIGVIETLHAQNPLPLLYVEGQNV